jgi:acyl-CoA thioesterase FadM
LTTVLFHHVDVRVMWSDTDPAAIVWFGVFFAISRMPRKISTGRLGCERTALLKELGIFMPRTSLQSRFKSPARLGEALSVGVGVADIADRRVTFAFDIHERGTNRLICDASYRVACVDAATFAPRSFPPEIVALLARAKAA